MAVSQQQDNLHDIARQVFKTRAGQKLLTMLDDMYGSRRSFSAGDPYMTAFKEGQRDTALYLVQLGRKSK